MTQPKPTANDLLWVASRITKPANLTPQAFCDWYENTHIQEVTALSGIPSAARYEQLPMPGFELPKEVALNYPWLTLYQMRDVEFRETEEFRGLDGQSEPEKGLLDRVFKNAEFDTRFWKCVQVDEASGSRKGPAPLLISAALQPPPSSESDFDAWYRHEHVPLISRCPGYVRTRRYKLVEASLLREFERGPSPAPSWLALHEFEGTELPMKELWACDETEWSKRVIVGLVKMEAGFFRLKRVYDEDEAPGSKL